MEGKKLNFNAPFLSVRVNRKIIKTPRPHRQLSVPTYRSDWELTEVVKPAAVPFVWEQTPGRPKNGSKTQSPPQEEPSITPRFPPGRVFDTIKRVSGEQFVDQTEFKPQIDASPPLNEIVKVMEMNGDFGSQNEDDACSDAYDTLSATESFSWTCSISGLSGYDGPYAKSSRTFTADPQTRDFMMTRFLPAARDMVIETPQYVPRKKPKESERIIHVKKVVSGELSPLLERYLSITASHHNEHKGNISSEDEEDEYNGHGRKSGKACGLLSRLSARISMPVHGMKSRAQSSFSSAPEVRRMARTAFSGPLPHTHHEKHDWNDIYLKNILSRARSRELVENKLTGISNQFHPSSDFYVEEGLSTHRRSSGGGISPYRNEKPRSPFNDGAKFLGIPKIIKNTEADKLSSISKVSDKFRDSGSLDNLVEKTLYVDSVNNTKVPILDLVFSEVEELNKFSSETLFESKGMQKFSNPNSCTQAERLKKPKAIRSVNGGILSSPCSLNLKGEEYSIEGLKYDQDLDQEARSLQCSVVHPIENLIMKNENTKKVNDHGDSNFGYLQLARPPPLPKSPSESWLWRTLPSISLRNPFSQVQIKKTGEKISASSAKWETIVKTSHVRHDHKRYSEELTSRIWQHSKA